MDTVYVVYLNGEMYRTSSRKTAYLEKRYAKQIITSDSKSLAQNMYHNQANKSWWDLSKEQKEEWIKEAKKRFEIKEFIEKQVK